MVKWLLGKVVKVCGPRTYLVHVYKMGKNRFVHIDHILPSQEESQVIIPETVMPNMQEHLDLTRRLEGRKYDSTGTARENYENGQEHTAPLCNKEHSASPANKTLSTTTPKTGFNKEMQSSTKLVTSAENSTTAKPTSFVIKQSKD